MADDVVAPRVPGAVSADAPGVAAPAVPGGPSPDASRAASPEAPAAAARTRAELLRYALGLVVGIVVLALLFGRRSELAAAIRQLGSASPAWIAAAIGAESLSLLCYAGLQRRVLRLAEAGAKIPMPRMFLLSLANDAIACTVPGEPAPSSGYRYRYYRRWGASPAAAGWAVFTILVAQAVGMSLILLTGVLIALAASAVDGGRAASPAGVGVTALGLLIVLCAGAVLIRRDVVLGLASAVTGRLARRRNRPPGGQPRGLLTRIAGTLARMRDIPLGPAATASVVALATGAWAFDFGCLLCGFRAVDAPIPWRGVLLAYGAAVVAGSLPIVPGGLGIVEGSLAVVLVSYGASRLPAVSAVLAFRMVNYWLAIVVGWISVGLVAVQVRRHPDSGGAVDAGAAS
jgi:putative heme transporter